MTKISREELLKLAKMSRLELHEGEIAPLMEQLDQVLSYAARVQEVAADAQEPPQKNVNVFREDVIVRKDATKIIAQAPEREDNYFVVPKIIENN